MNDFSKVSQFMVRDVVHAKLWHPISYVRQQMLKHAFSYLPIRHENAWKLVAEFEVARLLRNVSLGTERRQRMVGLVSDQIADGTLKLLEAHAVPPEMAITEALQLIGERPVLVVDPSRPDELAGLLTTSDVL